MPRKRSGDAVNAQGGNPPRPRQRKKKEPVNTYDIKPEANMVYDMQGMPNGMQMMPDDGNQYGHAMPPDYYYHQQGGPTSTASANMNNGYGPPSHPHGPPQPNPQQMPYQDLDPSHHHQQQQQLPPPQQQQMPPPSYMHPMNPSQSQPPPQMMPQPGPPPGVMNPMQNIPPGGSMNPQHNPGVPPQMMLRPPHLPPPMSHFPQPPLLEYRITEMNKRMYSFYHQQFQVAIEHHAQWWEAFGQEFFDEEARMNLILHDIPENPKKYSLGKRLISKFFRTMFENGVRELQFLPRAPSSEHMSQWGACSLECENVIMFTRLNKPFNAEIVTEARMFIEFAPYDETYGYRIRHFTLELKNSQEYILRQLSAANDMDVQERARYGLTKCGIPNKAINYLKLCTIMEPMQHIMNYCKQNPTTLPRDALKHILFQYHSSRKNTNPPPPMPQNIVQQMPPIPQQNMIPPQPPIEEPVKKTRKRTRKTNNTANGPNTATPAKTQQRKGNSRTSPSHNVNNFPINQNYNVNQYQEVLVVGEPSLMGGDFGEEDERSISRIENTQYDGSLMNHGGPGSGMPQSTMNTPMSVAMQTNGSTPNYSRQNSFNRGIEIQKMPPPQTAPLIHSTSSSQLSMLPPTYDMSMMNNGWKSMPIPNNMNPSMMAQTICDQ